MTHLKREQIANADEVDAMLGTTHWKAEARGTYGDLDAVSIKWIDGTHRGYPVQREAETMHSVMTPGISADDDREIRRRARIDGCAFHLAFRGEHRGRDHRITMKA